MCVQALGLGFCLSFSVYPLGASAFDRTSTKAGTSPSGESPACLQQEEESPPASSHAGGVAPSPRPRRTLPRPLALGGLWERICFLVRACSIPSTLVWNCTMDSQAHGSSSGVGRK